MSRMYRNPWKLSRALRRILPYSGLAMTLLLTSLTKAYALVSPVPNYCKKYDALGKVQEVNPVNSVSYDRWFEDHDRGKIHMPDGIPMTIADVGMEPGPVV